MLSKYLLVFSFNLCIILTLLSPSAVMAESGSGIKFAMSGSLLHFGYRELDGAGNLLDREDGYIPGGQLELSKTVDRWVFGGEFSYHEGTVLYTGQTNSGIPVSTLTRQNIADIALRAEYHLKNERGLDYGFYFGLACHQWDRDIQSTTTPSGSLVSGLFERYEWRAVFLGAQAVIYESSSFRLLLDERLTQTVRPNINIDFNGLYDKSRLALGERWGFRLAFPLYYSISSSIGLKFEPYMESVELGSSALVPLKNNGTVVASVYEPDSLAVNYGLMFGVRQNF